MNEIEKLQDDLKDAEMVYVCLNDKLHKYQELLNKNHARIEMIKLLLERLIKENDK